MPGDPVADLPRLAERLAPVEADAAALPWAGERPWRVASHLRVEGELLHLDLHDLDARGARSALGVLAEAAPALESGAIRLVCGVGRHSLGPGVLGSLLRRELARLCRRRGWSHHPAGPGAFVLVFDAARAPPRASSTLGAAFWLWVVPLAALVAVVWPWSRPPLLLAAALLLLRGWRRWRGRAGAAGHGGVAGLSSERPPRGAASDGQGRAG